MNFPNAWLSSLHQTIKWSLLFIETGIQFWSIQLYFTDSTRRNFAVAIPQNLPVVHTDEYISNEGIFPINIATHVIPEDDVRLAMCARHHRCITVPTQSHEALGSAVLDSVGYDDEGILPLRRCMQCRGGQCGSGSRAKALGYCLSSSGVGDVWTFSSGAGNN
jgi:hypothetical protein